MMRPPVIETYNTRRMLAEMIYRASDLTPIMDQFGKYMVRSVRKNFDQGGRPKKWDRLKYWPVVPKGTKRTRWNQFKRMQGRARMGGPLVLTGDLRAHIGYEAEPKDLVLYATPEYDAVKAPVHQRGTDKAGRGRNVIIPARPYLVFQREDIQYFKKLASGWLRVGANVIRRGGYYGF